MLSVDKKLVILSIITSLLSLFWGFIRKFMESLGLVNEVVIFVTGIILFIIIILLLFFLIREYLREKRAQTEMENSSKSKKSKKK